MPRNTQLIKPEHRCSETVGLFLAYLFLPQASTQTTWSGHCGDRETVYGSEHGAAPANSLRMADLLTCDSSFIQLWPCCLLGGDTKGWEERDKGQGKECLVFADFVGRAAGEASQGLLWGSDLLRPRQRSAQGMVCVRTASFRTLS